MFLSFVAIISTLAFVSSLTLNKVNDVVGTQNLEKSELGKKIVQGIIAKIEEKISIILILLLLFYVIN
jgi:hypothetical protein